MVDLKALCLTTARAALAVSGDDLAAERSPRTAATLPLSVLLAVSQPFVAGDDDATRFAEATWHGVGQSGIALKERA